MTTYTPFPLIGSGPLTFSDPRNSVSMRQARLALIQQPNPVANGTGTMLDAVNAAVAANTTDPTFPIWWDYASSVDIDDPRVYVLGTSFGLTQEQVENLFTLASTL